MDPLGGAPTTARTAVGRRTGDPDPGHQGPDAGGQRPSAPDPGRRGLPRGVGLALVAGILVVAGAVSLNLVSSALERLNPFRNGVVQETTVDRSGPVVLQAITDMGSFRAASGYYELVVDVEKDVEYVPSVLAGQRVLFVAAGTVEVGVDLRDLDPSKVTVDPARTTAAITLPRPRLSEPRIDVERSYIYSRERGLVDRLRGAVGSGSDDEKELYGLASRRLAEAAQATGELTARGEANTRAMLEGLLRSLGYTDITVTFAG